MRDRLGREIDYLRISLTESCNLNCLYCNPLRGQGAGCNDQEGERLELTELYFLCTLFVRSGVRRFKITGGEPLLRPGCLSFAARLKSLEGVEEVTLTTNGVLLEEVWEEVKQSGLDGINISLDSLDHGRFRRLTGKDALPKVLKGIDRCVNFGIRTKINCVPIRGVNDGEICKIAALSRNQPIDVRFIELMPIGFGKYYEGMSAAKVRSVLTTAYGVGEEITGRRGNGPAVYCRFPGFRGCTGFIDAVHEKFCRSCNRIRLTSRGVLKTCLFYEEGLELGRMLRENRGERELLQAVEKAIFEKKEEHHFCSREWEKEKETKGMVKIGG